MEIYHDTEKDRLTIVRYGVKRNATASVLMIETSVYIPRVSWAPYTEFEGYPGQWFWLCTQNRLNEGDPHTNKDYFNWPLKEGIELVDRPKCQQELTKIVQRNNDQGRIGVVKTLLEANRDFAKREIPPLTIPDRANRSPESGGTR